MRVTQADRGSLFIHDRKHKQLWSKIADDVAEIRVASNAGIVGAVCQSAKALNIEDAYKDPRFNRRIDTATGYRTRTILCVPIKNQRGEVVAVVQCINKLNQAAFTHVRLWRSGAHAPPPPPPPPPPPASPSPSPSPSHPVPHAN